jgi:excisionase family DNA binding protein
MNELRVQDLSREELLREVESAATEAVAAELQDLRQTIDRLRSTVYINKTWLSLEEAARYVSVSTTTLREWRNQGLKEANMDGRVYIRREDLDAFIASHAE